LSNTDHTWHDLGWNRGHRDVNPVTNSLSHGTALHIWFPMLYFGSAHLFGGHLMIQSVSQANGVGQSDRGQIWDIILAFSWRNLEELRRTSVRGVSVLTEIRTRHLRDTNHMPYRFRQLAQPIVLSKPVFSYIYFGHPSFWNLVFVLPYILTLSPPIPPRHFYSLSALFLCDDILSSLISLYIFPNCYFHSEITSILLHTVQLTRNEVQAQRSIRRRLQDMGTYQM
jgi:hypothetical protein